MHPDNKLASHGKTGSSTSAPSHHHNVSHSPTCSLGTKGVGAGSHGGGGNGGSGVGSGGSGGGGKVSQPVPGGSNAGLKTGQAPVPPFGGLKGKAKRERSVSVDSGERQEASALPLDKELKGEVAPRSKRRCVLERKQPYSGDEWCSGPESEEDEKVLGSTHNCNVAEPAMTTGSQLGSGSNPLPTLGENNTSGPPHGPGPGLRSDAGNGGGNGGGNGAKQPLQLVYVFTTHLANTAAEAILQGRADSILRYHQQHVPRAKLDQHLPQAKIQGVPESLPINASPINTTSSQPAMPPSSQASVPPLPSRPTPPQSAATPQLGPGPLPPSTHPLPAEGPPEETRRDLTPNSVGNVSGSSTLSSAHPDTPTGPPGTLPPGTADDLLGEEPNTEPPSAGGGARNALPAEGLSKEQLEHRERSLQTLRDIERLLLRSSESEPFLKGPPGESGRAMTPQAPPPPPPSQPPPPVQGMKKYEEPLQSMISQTQSLGGPGGLEAEGPLPPGVDMGQQMNLMMQRLGQDSLTPEQVAWRKLQEEYYEEKRRKEEQVGGLHGRRPPLPDMMLGQPMGGVMLRGPPPPYHSKPAEQWLLRGVPVDVQEQLQLRPAFAGGPRFATGQMQRSFGGAMQNLPLEALGPLSAMQRPANRPGMAWNEEGPLGAPGNFAPGHLAYPPGQGEAERFLATAATTTARAREEMMLRQQQQQQQQQHLLEKQRQAGGGGGGMPRPLSLELERTMLSHHRAVDPGLFAGEGLGSLEFGGGSRAMMSPPLRDLEPALGAPGNLNMNMNVNMNMNMNLNVQMTPQQQQQQQQQQQMLMAQKMPGPDLSAEEMARARAPNGTGALMGAPQKMMMGSPFSGQGGQPPPQPPGFPLSAQGPYPTGPQEMGPSQELLFEPGSLASTPRLSHMPPAPGAPSARSLGRRPSDLALNLGGQMGSPGLGNRLKSPPLGQVHSPLGHSPSASLKSPQTPSALVSLPAGNPSGGPLKSPQVLSSVLSVRSPTSSPSRLKSPSMAVASPGWVPSPGNTLASPGLAQSKPALGMSNAAPNVEQDPAPSQNPLSLMMSQMSKYALPSSTPLYHNAIKTIATSDDEMLPDRPMMPPGGPMPGLGGNQPNPMHMNSVGPPPAQSPMGMSLPGQQPLSHEPPATTLSSPGPLGSNIPLHGNAGPPNLMMLPPGAQDAMGQACGPPGQLVFPPRLQQPPTNGGSLPMAHGGAGGPQGMQHYPPGMGMPPEELTGAPPPSQMHPPTQQQQRLAGRLPEPYTSSVLPGVASVLGDPDLSDVIRPTPTGIPEFDLSRIIPSEKPSSTLQYFPKGEGPGAPKVQAPSNLHLMNLQNMMAEQAPARPGPQGMQRGMGGLCHPGQVPLLGRTGLGPQPGGMMGNSLPPQGMVLPQQNLLAQQNFLLMQAKQRSLSVSGEMYGQPPGHMMSPQGSLMGPPPQQNLMLSHPMRQRSISLDGQISYGPGGGGGGGMANLPF